MLCPVLGIAASAAALGDGAIVWIAGGEGLSCTEACAVHGQTTCVDAELRGLGDAAAGVMAAVFACSGQPNGWDYGQGYSQCVDSGCCGGNCIGACSFPAAAADAGCDAAPPSSHSRLCPCGEALPPPPPTPPPPPPYECARANDAVQRAAAPNWAYVTDANGQIADFPAPEPVNAGLEPVLEPVVGCNGLSQPGALKRFSFLVVLDGSWVAYYNDRSADFAAQGYPSLEESPNLLLDRVSYLFEAQFGAQVAAGRVVAAPELGEACATNNNHADDGTDATSTTAALARRSIVPGPADALTLRLGVGSLSGVYCHSTAPIGGLCDELAIVTNQRAPLHAGGQVHHGAVRTLAHELGHAFGICDDRNNPHCLNGHTANDIADIMVDDGRPASNVRSEGMFSKFMTTCSTVYDTMVCSRIKAADAECGVIVGATTTTTPPLTVTEDPVAACLAELGTAPAPIPGPGKKPKRGAFPSKKAFKKAIRAWKADKRARKAYKVARNAHAAAVEGCNALGGATLRGRRL